MILFIEELEFTLTIIIGAMLFSFAIAFPIINLLYKLKITRRMGAEDFTSMIGDRASKHGVPIMGGLIVIITVTILNILFNPYNDNAGVWLLLFIFILSALLGGADDVLNIYGFKRKNPRALSRTIKLIKVHKSRWMRVRLAVTFPWEAYKRMMFVLGSNPGKGIQAHEKLLIQSIVGLALGIGLYFYSSREMPGEIWFPVLNETIDIGFLIIPFAWLTVLLMTNAVNIADGMDGLAASQLMASFFGFLIIALVQEDYRISFMIATVIGSLISYLYFNIPPARFQMGDVGSLALGSLLAGIAFLLGQPLMLLIISLPFAITLLSTVIQGMGRRLLGKRVFRMAPIHYHLQMRYGWAEEKIVFRVALFAAACMITGLWVYVMGY